MTSPPNEVELSAERWLPVAPDRIWAQCTTKQGLESWWSPEDLRTTVKRIDPRAGGELVLAVRYVPAMLGQRREDAFRPAGVPISFALKGTFVALEPKRKIIFALTLSIDRTETGIETVTELDFHPQEDGTHVRLHVRGTSEPHMLAQGKANIEGQLERLARSLGVEASRMP